VDGDEGVSRDGVEQGGDVRYERRKIDVARREVLRPCHYVVELVAEVPIVACEEHMDNKICEREVCEKRRSSRGGSPRKELRNAAFFS